MTHLEEYKEKHPDANLDIVVQSDCPPPFEGLPCPILVENVYPSHGKCKKCWELGNELKNAIPGLSDTMATLEGVFEDKSTMNLQISAETFDKLMKGEIDHVVVDRIENGIGICKEESEETT